MSGRGKSRKSIELIDFAVDWFAANYPASVRACCYQLFVAGLIDSMSKSETNKVSRLLRDAREQGLLPWDHVVDESRDVEQVMQWDDPATRLRAAARNYRRDNWQDQPYRIEVWSEKGTVRGTLAPVLDEFGVAFRVMHGYSSATVLHQIAEESLYSNKPLITLYLGDWDPSGLHMSEVDIPGRIARYGGKMSFNRIALVEEDLTHLPYFDAKTKCQDGRYQWFVRQHGTRCWELDAMSPPVLRQRVEGAILEYMDVAAWNHSLSIEAAELESMKGFFDNIASILQQASKYEARP
jgi:hypothetical protein